MKSANKTQIAVISGSLVLFVLLLFANTTIPKSENEGTSGHAGKKTESISTLVENARKGLTADQKQKVEKLEGALKTAPDKKLALKMIIDQWDSLKQSFVGAYYLEQVAVTSPTDSNWLSAGNSYYKATRSAKKTELPTLYARAIECFEKTLNLNPKMVDAKINLGACYVEGTEQPMKGITLLKEVEKTDSNNINLQLNFAYFSERSGQWDKAIARFEKILKLKPDNTEVYLQIADAYEQKGNKSKAIEFYEKYASLVADSTTKTEVQNYINKLKN